MAVLKYLVVVLVVVGLAWMMFRPKPAKRPPKDPGPKAQPMVQCAHCGVHLPRADAVEDRRGLYCNEAHRLAGPREP